jgi:hypothetical protein
MNWEILGTVVGALLGVAELANLFLNNRTRADVAELKLWITEQRSKDSRELRDHVDAEFVRKDVFDARLDALRAKV